MAIALKRGNPKDHVDVVKPQNDKGFKAFWLQIGSNGPLQEGGTARGLSYNRVSTI